MDGVTLIWVVVAVVVVAYVFSVFRWPRQRCKRCTNFSGRIHAPFGSVTYRKCTRCKGTGWHIRPMRRFLGGRDKFDGSGVWQGP
ncbi:hypothetical protein [Actinomycetospora lemnae]|uniref:Uncharacterized protein n=1 Tax=Actinomycetospora lemnae TaxID=3019891 RepID=A0ABT5SPV9_9PSEU|nr:hypothetical protein [Actinomycetospora sp. DW7H6]MDD7964819.1 hypothetical protein [Actinomycetospora sp. DW7H6]